MRNKRGSELVSSQTILLILAVIVGVSAAVLGFFYRDKILEFLSKFRSMSRFG